MGEKQKTIQNEFSLSGIGLHSGCHVKLNFKPAAENTGITFVRVDLPQAPVIKAELSNVFSDAKIPRCTSIGRAEMTIHTVEHLMAVLCGVGISNLTIEINAKELPGLDGGGNDFLKAIKQAGILEQKAQREVFEIKEPLGVSSGGSSIYVFPSNKYQIAYTLDYDHPWLHSQFFTTELDEKIFEREIAPCRTFCLESETKELKSVGLGQGATYENTLVVGQAGVKGNQMRFKDECARHKVLDLIGDLYLLGMPIKGHVFAVKSGHQLNIELLKKIWEQKEKYQKKTSVPIYDLAGKKEIDIQGIMKILPHRYPFLLVDRVVEIETGKKALGIKNVTINDGFFQGHFPARPVMPGVLMVEAMAQTAGVVILTSKDHHGKVAFFMAADKVKFRKVVVPGDQLLMEVEVVRDRASSAQVHARARVGTEIVAEAEMIFSFTDASYLD